jgi:hypothetical protein
MRLSLRVLYLPLFGLLPLVLTGCTMTSSAPATPEQGVAIQGRVYGGQVPLFGAQVYLFQANTTGYAGPGITGSAGNASKSLLTSVAGQTTQDTTMSDATFGDYYVTTSGVTGACPNGGCFAITSDYTCTGGTQVYLYSLGGGSGTTSYSNSGAGMLAALGTCPGTAGSTGNTFSSGLFIVVNEVSTIATAYAFAGFATDALHVSSSGTALAQTGIANAFANVTNMETQGTGGGVALATTPIGGGTVPQAEINTLADILAACVNTTAPSSTACTNLFTNAQTNGSTGGTPSDTATAAINLAHNPGLTAGPLYSNFSLILPTSPFQPTLTSVPNDFTIALNFTAGGISTPTAIAIDGGGNGWITNNGSTPSVTRLSPLGVALDSSPLAPTGSGLQNPSSIAIDSSGNAWIADDYITGNITALSSTGSLLTSAPFTGGGISQPGGIAVDGSGRIIAGNYGQGMSGDVSVLSSSGTAISGSSGDGPGIGVADQGVAVDGLGNIWTINGYLTSMEKVVINQTTGAFISPATNYDSGINDPMGVAIDDANDVWICTHGSKLVVLNGSGTVISTGTGLFTGGGLQFSQAIAMDGASNAWIVNTHFGSPANGDLSEFSQSGQVLSPNAGYTSSTMSSTNPMALAIDGSGDVWVTNNGNSSVTEFIGAGVPVITPLAAGVASNKLGTRP